jgi:hypothetical protein
MMPLLAGIGPLCAACHLIETGLKSQQPHTGEDCSSSGSLRILGFAPHSRQTGLWIGAEREGHGEGIAAVGPAGGLIVERIVDAVDLLLDRPRHRVLDHLLGRPQELAGRAATRIACFRVRAPRRDGEVARSAASYAGRGALRPDFPSPNPG